MKTKIVAVVVLAALLLSAGAGAVVFTDTFGNFQDNKANGWGQTFTPAKATIAPPETVIPQTVYLEDWTFARTNSAPPGTTQPAEGETYLAVYSALTVAQMNSSTLVGLSTNWVDMFNTPLNYPDSLMTWQFDSLALDKDTQYALMFVQSDIEGLHIVPGAVRLRTKNQYTYGGWIRINEVANDWDADFVATYNTVPEPATMILLGLGSLLLRRGRA